MYEKALHARFFFGLTIALGAQAAVGSKTGFKVISDTPQLLRLKHTSNLEISVSKERFSSQSEARAFCAQLDRKLDQDFNVLLLAMSGALEDKFLKSAATFSLKSSSHVATGIWSWNPEKDEVLMMFDGQGTTVTSFAMSDIQQGKRFQLPAVCVK